MVRSGHRFEHEVVARPVRAKRAVGISLVRGQGDDQVRLDRVPRIGVEVVPAREEQLSR